MLWRFCLLLWLVTHTAIAGELDGLLDPIDPQVSKWASIVRVTGPAEKPDFHWQHYRTSETAIDFWPASTIKIYAVIAALEQMEELGFPLDAVYQFERKTGGNWVLDSSRTMKEMISEVFRRSSNEDYTLLLRSVGVDRINTQLLTVERGFPHSALMRGYVKGRPYEYVREERQRITIRTPDRREHHWEHEWSGTSYSQLRGASVISDRTGNCTTTRELADCLRRVMFHEVIPESDRFRISTEKLEFLRRGGDGLTGLEQKGPGSFAWEGAVEQVFPKARYSFKLGQISTHTLDLCYIDDAESGVRCVMALASGNGKSETVRKMSLAICQQLKAEAKR